MLAVRRPRNETPIRLAFVLLGATALLACTSRETEAATKAGSSTAFLPTIENKERPTDAAPDGMVWIPGGTFSMGSEVASEGLCCQKGTTRDSQPVHRVYVDGFWMDKTEVKNAQFE